MCVWALLPERDCSLVNVVLVLLVVTKPTLVAGFTSSVLFAHWSMKASLVAVLVCSGTMRFTTEDLGKKPYKIIKRHELTEHHERMRAERNRHILAEIAQGTLPNFVFTDQRKLEIQKVVNHQNDQVWSSSSLVEGRIVTRRQNAQSHGLCSCDRYRKISACFCALWGQTELRTVHLCFFKIKVAIMGCKTFSGFTMESLTGFSTITWLQRNPNLNSEEHSIFHKQRCMASKEPRPQSLKLFYLVHFGDKDLSYPSHFSRVPQRKTARECGSNSTKTDTCRL
ncbi:hypothetical protein FHG87_024966 [Trinorchestia longiramus]|nr:hypothetical protein FHG87_024966 [Trinorchestia longiramus]